MASTDTRPWVVTDGEKDHRRCWFKSTAEELLKIMGRRYRLEETGQPVLPEPS